MTVFIVVRWDNNEELPHLSVEVANNKDEAVAKVNERYPDQIAVIAFTKEDIDVLRRSFPL